MASVLMAYGTTEGQTRKICETAKGWIETSGHSVCLVDSAAVPAELDFNSFDVFILAGSIHQGQHQKSLVEFVRRHRTELEKKPSALLSVSLSATVKDEEHLAEATQCIGKFIQETGWMPTTTKPVAGALKYLEYDWLKRMVLKMIARQEGGSSDTSRDHEYTDWDDLHRFLDSFLQKHLC